MSPPVHPIGVPARFYGHSHVGCVRTANEDSYIIADLAGPDARETTALLVVADGMGGSVGGAQASRAVVQTIRDQLASGIRDQPGLQLAEAVRLANRTVHAIPMQQPALRGMGSTCTALVLHADQVHIAHVGDSRAYLIRDRRILQLTHDHTKVHLLLQTGMITPEEAAVHPERSVLVRSIGPKPDVEVEVLPPLTLQAGDRVVLCSDGLINHVADPEILALVEDQPEGAVVEALIQLALERGGSDNTTVLLIAMGPEPPPRRTAPPAPATVMEDVPPRAATVAHADDAEPAGLPLGRLAIAVALALGLVGLGGALATVLLKADDATDEVVHTRDAEPPTEIPEDGEGRETRRPPTPEDVEEDLKGAGAAAVAPGGADTLDVPDPYREPRRPAAPSTPPKPDPRPAPTPPTPSQDNPDPSPAPTPPSQDNPGPTPDSTGTNEPPSDPEPDPPQQQPIEAADP